MTITARARRIALAAAFATTVLAAGAAHASVLYDNGAYNGHAAAPNITGGNYATDSFALDSGATVNGVQFVAWNYAPTNTTASVDWAIYSGAPQPYTASPLIATGTALVTNAFLFTNTQGYGVYADTFAIPALALLSGTYSLQLANALTTVPDGQVSWDTNSGPSTAVVRTNFGPFEGYQASQSFQILGSSTSAVAAVPEPATWAMMLLGFGCVGGALRSARRRQAAVCS